LNALTNFGWSLFEGPWVYHGKVKLQGKGKLTAPVYSYAHGASFCAIVGGYVIAQRYYFGDFCSGRIWYFKVGPMGRGPGRVVELDRVPDLVSFGEIGSTLYAVSMDGTVYRIGS
jgi:hypothetical protein